MLSGQAYLPTGYAIIPRLPVDERIYKNGPDGFSLAAELRTSIAWGAAQASPSESSGTPERLSPPLSQSSILHRDRGQDFLSAWDVFEVATRKIPTMKCSALCCAKNDSGMLNDRSAIGAGVLRTRSSSVFYSV